MACGDGNDGAEADAIDVLSECEMTILPPPAVPPPAWFSITGV